MKTLSKEKFLGKPKHNQGDKNKDARGIRTLAYIATANIKHSPTPSQIDIKPHTNSLLLSVPLTWYVMPDFQLKITRHVNGKKKQSEETK